MNREHLQRVRSLSRKGTTKREYQDRVIALSKENERLKNMIPVFYAAIRDLEKRVKKLERPARARKTKATQS